MHATVQHDKNLARQDTETPSIVAVAVYRFKNKIYTAVTGVDAPGVHSAELSIRRPARRQPWLAVSCAQAKCSKPTAAAG